MEIGIQPIKAILASISFSALLAGLTIPANATAANEKKPTALGDAKWQDGPELPKQVRPPIKIMTVQTTSARWKNFMELTPQKLSGYWNGHLSSYHWSWRQGWLQQCGKLTQRLCLAILEQGVNDKAAVVRSKAAEVLGSKFENTDSALALKLITNGLSNKKNFRGNQPLFVVKRLLWAFAAVKINKSEATAPEIVATSPELRLYWSKLISPHMQKNIR